MTTSWLVKWLALVSVMTGLNRGVTCLPAFSLEGPLNLEKAILLQSGEMEEVLHREERGVSSGPDPEVPLGLADPEDIVTTPVQNKPEILKLAVLSRVTARFASTEVSSKVRNVGRKAAEATFTIKLPVDAFITAFSMTIEDVVYHSEVKPKEQAQKAYDAARARGQTAGQVKQSSPEESTKFTVSVTISARTSVLFNLTYQQLLKRKEGRFENSISIQPGQNVPDIRVEVYVTEPQGLAWLNTTWRLGDESDERKLDNMTSVDLRDRSAYVLFDTRGEGALTSRNGIMGDFIVHYDVMHDDMAGRLEIVEGYFVHYFSPSGLPKAKKNVVFVVDTSGSMSGLKIRQTKQALTTILDDVRPIDKFNIIFFNSDINVWRDGEMTEATRDNIENAQSFVDGIRATGGTNIYDALMKAVELLITNMRNECNEALSLIIMLTDGEPTSGPITSTAGIISGVSATIEGRVSLFSLGFGSGVDYTFLERLSLSNNGLARKIYTDSSASIQVKDFYDEVANPLLFDISITYDDELIDSESLTKSTFKSYFDGTEITVAGKLKDEFIHNVCNTGNTTECGSFVHSESHELELGVAVSARSCDLNVVFNTSTRVEPDRPFSKREVESFTKRLWAYLTIENLLDQRKTATNDQIKRSLTQRALNLSLDYHFVTLLTSLLVVRPDDPAENTTTIDGEQQLIEEEEGEDALASIPGRPFTRATGQRALVIDACSSLPCTNGGLCINGVNGYTCTCQYGYAGTQCASSVIGQCYSLPCLNGGTCIDEVNGFSCICHYGFGGTHCERAVSECSSAPCQNGGTCIDGDNGYFCSCRNGYDGFHCDVDVNECSSSPCQNGALCIDGVNGYTCNCRDGYDGIHCERDYIPPFINLTVLALDVGELPAPNTELSAFVADTSALYGTTRVASAFTGPDGVARLEVPHNQSIIVTASREGNLVNSITTRAHLRQDNVVTIPMTVYNGLNVFLWRRASSNAFEFGGEDGGTQYRVAIPAGGLRVPERRRVQIEFYGANVTLPDQFEYAPEPIAAINRGGGSRGDHGALMADDSEVDLVPLEIVGMVELNVIRTDTQMKPRVTMPVSLIIPIAKLPADLQVGDRLDAWYFALEDGVWIRDGEGVIAQDGDSGMLVWEYEATHFTWWAAGRPQRQHTCVRARACLDDACITPVPNIRIRMVGEDYGFVSSRITDGDGEALFTFKHAGTVTLEAVCAEESVTVASTTLPTVFNGSDVDIPTIRPDPAATTDSCREVTLVVGASAANLTCPDPGQVQFAVRTLGGVEYSDSVHYKCPMGLSPSSAEGYRTCLECGQWTGSPIVC